MAKKSVHNDPTTEKLLAQIRDALEKLGEVSEMLDNISRQRGSEVLLKAEQRVAEESPAFARFISGRWKRRSGTVYGPSREQGLAETPHGNDDPAGTL